LQKPVRKCESLRQQKRPDLQGQGRGRQRCPDADLFGGGGKAALLRPQRSALGRTASRARMLKTEELLKLNTFRRFLSSANVDDDEFRRRIAAARQRRDVGER
jgi:hypothetical protein